MRKKPIPLWVIVTTALFVPLGIFVAALMVWHNLKITFGVT